MGPQFPGSRVQALPKVFQLTQINSDPIIPLRTKKDIRPSKSS